MQKVQGFTQQGNITVAIAGTGNVSSNDVQGSFPACTVTVYGAGTLVASTLFADNATVPTSKGNPFTAGADGTWFFYAANGRYDVVFSGGGITTPFTLGDIQAFDNLLPVAFASLPTGVLGMTATVTDSNTVVWGATIAGGSTNKVLAFYNGTNWTVAGK